MATAVVCDYDSVLRAAVSTACEHAGLEVVAETDHGGDALELVRRFGVDVLVLDVSLNDGSGFTTVREALAEQERPEVVVFTAYEADRDLLLELGVRDVVAKPDVERLGDVLTGVALSLQEAAERAGQDRRAASRRVPAAEIWRSPAGISRSEDLLLTAEHTEPGDAVLVICATHDAGGRATAPWSAGELLRQTVRVQDLVHDLPVVDGYVAVLRGGDEGAPGAVWQRVCDRAAGTDLEARLRAGSSRVDELGLMAAIDRAVEGLADDAPQPGDLQGV